MRKLEKETVSKMEQLLSGGVDEPDLLVNLFLGSVQEEMCLYGTKWITACVRTYSDNHLYLGRFGLNQRNPTLIQRRLNKFTEDLEISLFAYHAVSQIHIFWEL